MRDVPLDGLDPKQLEMGQTSKHDDRQSRWTPRNAAQTQTHPASVNDLLQIYMTYVRQVLEYFVPVWQPGLTTTQTARLERVEKRALRTILGDKYTDYQTALFQV